MRSKYASPLLLALAACAASREERSRANPVWLVEPAAEETFRAPGPVDLADGLDLAGVLQLAAERNPRLAASRQRWLAARQRPAQEGALPDPMLAYMPMISDIETRVGPMEDQFQVSLRIPYPGRLAAAADLADEEARIAELDYRITLRDTVADLKVTYVELLYLRKALRIVEQNRALAQQLSEKSAALYGGQREEKPDAVTLFDTLKAQSQLAQLAYDTITLEELRHTEEANLNQLLSRGPEAPVGMPHDLRFRPLRVPKDEILRLALAHRQELEAALRRVVAADHAHRLAQLVRVPDFTVGATYTMIGPAVQAVPGSGDDALALSFGITLPIWATKNRARVAEAEHRREAARLDRQAAVDDLMARITKVYFRMENAERLVRLYKESLIPQAEEAMEIAEQWRDVGRDTLGRTLEAQSVWLNFQLAYHRALADHEQMVARLEQLVGTSLGDLRGDGAAEGAAPEEEPDANK